MFRKHNAKNWSSHVKDFFLYNMGMFELLEKQKITATGLIVVKQCKFDQATLTVFFLTR